MKQCLKCNRWFYLREWCKECFDCHSRVERELCLKKAGIEDIKRRWPQYELNQYTSRLIN